MIVYTMQELKVDRKRVILNLQVQEQNTHTFLCGFGLIVQSTRTYWINNYKIKK